ncbi:hypothetical protein SKAU_G00066330 [Synaphobranchus kaupii]|uniref:Uncharacterized protein n=1 Tax=Synaphobranchus kaupii TaxID=118154 RepID=A0A9Q1JAW0_SYNKA|nr:hypothetical protein SKAU_G00066330 [Synaphobranchus kaupii]
MAEESRASTIPAPRDGKGGGDQPHQTPDEASRVPPWSLSANAIEAEICDCVQPLQWRQRECSDQSIETSFIVTPGYCPHLSANQDFIIDQNPGASPSVRPSPDPRGDSDLPWSEQGQRAQTHGRFKRQHPPQRKARVSDSNAAETSSH